MPGPDDERYGLDESFDSELDEDEVTKKKDMLTRMVEELLTSFDHSYTTFKKSLKNDDTAMYNHLLNLANNVKNSIADPSEITGSRENQYKVEHFANRVAKIVAKFDPKDKNPGRRLYEELKKAQIKVDNEYHKATLQDNNRYDQPYDNLVGEHTFFENLSDLLKGGNELLRGSSSQYKEVEKLIKDLQYDVEKIHSDHRFDYSVEDKRYIRVCFQNIYEKAMQYVTDRKATEMECKRDSYKGKRIDIMRQVANMVKNRLEKTAWFTVDDGTCTLSKTYMDKIANKLKGCTFSKTLYSEYRALSDKLNHDQNCTLMDAINGSTTYAEDPATATLKKTFKNKKIDLKTAVRYAKVATKHINKTKEKVEAFDKAKLVKEQKRLQIIVDGNTSGKNLDFLNHPILGDGIDEKKKTITGHRDFDRELAKKQIEIINEKLNPKKPTKQNEQKQTEQKQKVQEPKENEVGMNEAQIEIVGMTENY